LATSYIKTGVFAIKDEARRRGGLRGKETLYRRFFFFAFFFFAISIMEI